MMINDKNLDLKKLEIFYHLYKEQSFSRAAKQLGLNQSVVSKTIKELENIFNIVLIESNQKPLLFSKYAKELFTFCDAFDFELQNLEQNLSNFLNTQKEKFCINISITMNLGFILTEILKKILDEYPELSLNINYSKKININSFNQKNFFIMSEIYESALIHNEVIGKYELTFAASHEYIKKNGLPLQIDEISEHEFISAKNIDYSKILPPEVYEKLSKNLLIDNELSLANIASNGLGICILPKFILNYFPNLVAFEICKIPSLTLYISHSLVKKNHYLKIIIQLFKHYLTEKLYDIHIKGYHKKG